MKPNFLRALKAHAKKAWQEAKRPEGCLDDLMQRVRNAVRKEFKRPTDEFGPWPAATYPDKVIFNYSDDDDYIEVSWEEDSKGNITFGTPKKVRKKVLFEPIEESIKNGSLKISEPKRFTETIKSKFEIVESGEGKPFRVRTTGIKTDVINENGRRYSRDNIAKVLNMNAVCCYCKIFLDNQLCLFLPPSLYYNL